MSGKVRGKRTFVGGGAIVLGVLLGFLVVYGNVGVERLALTAAASPSLAQRCQTNSRVGQVNAPIVTDSACMQACSDPQRPGKQNPACICGQELGNADAGVTSCYNPGDCNPPAGLPACGSVEKPKLPEEQKGQGEGKGGEMPKMPEIPKGGGGQPKPEQPKDEECEKEPKPEHCKAGVSDSLLSSLTQGVKDFFTPDSSSEAGTQQSISERLQSFLTGGTSDTSNTSDSSSDIKNPTEAIVSPAISGSNAGQITPQGNAQTGANANARSGALDSAVTGFSGGAAANTDTSTGPILTAIRGITSRIQEILSSLF